MKQNWEIKKLGEVCEIECGTRVVRKVDGGSIYPVYGGGGATFKMDSFNRENCLVVSRFAMSETCTRLVKGKFFLNDSGLTLKANTDFITQSYLETFILGKNDDIYRLGRGAAQKNLDMKRFREITIRYPKSLSEQRRIVAILDAKFAKIDLLKAAAQKNLDNAEQLWKAKLEKEFGNKEWKMTKLGEVAKVSSSKRIYADELSQSGVPFLRVSDVVSRINGTETCDLYIPEEKYLSFVDKGLVPKENDVLVTSRGTLGLCYIIKSTDKFYFQDGMITWLALKENINPKLIYYLFDSQIVREQINNKAAGAAVSYISIADIKNFTIPIPSLDEQTAIVSRLDALSAQISELKAKYRRQIECCDELRQSLLRAAFEGEM